MNYDRIEFKWKWILLKYLNIVLIVECCDEEHGSRSGDHPLSGADPGDGSASADGTGQGHGVALFMGAHPSQESPAPTIWKSLPPLQQVSR